jgi:hypothetical protein
MHRVAIKLALEWLVKSRGASKLSPAIVISPSSMRLSPPVYVIGRQATTDLELGGYRVKRGYTVLMTSG